MLVGDKIHVSHYFGGCPACGECSGILNVGRNHWATCDVHKLRWPVGSNLFSSWRNEEESVWAKNQAHLEQCDDAPHVLPEGVWPADPEKQREELDAARRQQEQELRAARGRDEKRARAVANVSQFLQDALAPVAQNLAGDADIVITVGNPAGNTLRMSGGRVTVETWDDIPF